MKKPNIIKRPRLILTIMLGFTLAFASTLLTGCGYSTNQRAEAVEVADSYYDAIEAGDFEGALVFYLPKALETEPKMKPGEKKPGQAGSVTGSAKERLAELRDIRERYGTIKRRDLVYWRIKKVSVIGESGTRYELKYLVAYKRQTLMETVVLFKPLSDESPAIIDYFVSLEHSV